ncbi:hypothetical protein M0C34_07370 [Agarivorans sp. TSD2052]|uniref:hypothetical protein n=1 Tax=Agarivorans sp. TSD2052 TaxID=2937286 RepID=UPI00200C3093|nr:hypothetical protein [Agarivorans sp. TSD2052]UPW20074.1 hypothetical protein M0C34_07370 [Agarivorans sp. TSD2052]
MNKLYLHVGPHKTGTTLIQKFLLDNKNTLFRNNLVYPQRFIKFFGHHQFRDLVANKSLSKDDVNFINDKPHDFLLSSEDFISLGKSDFEYIKSLFDKKEIVVVYTWRRASYKMYSIWQEVIKHGGTDIFSDYFHEHIAKPGRSQMLSPDLKISMFCSVFGKNNVKIIDYERSSSENSLLRDFLSAVSIPWRDDFLLADDNPHAVNKSLDVLDVEIIRALNEVFYREFNLQGSKVRDCYGRLNTPDNAQLHELKGIIASYQYEINIGDYLIDSRAEQVLSSKFSANILNYQECLTVKKLKLVKPTWTLNQKAVELLRQAVTAMRTDM